MTLVDAPPRAFELADVVACPESAAPVPRAAQDDGPRFGRSSLGRTQVGEVPANGPQPLAAVSAPDAAAPEPEALLAGLEALRAQVVAVGRQASGASEWSAAQRQAVWSALDHLSAAAGVARAAWLSADLRAGTVQSLGDSSEAAALARRSGCGTGQGHAQLRAADTLEALPVVADAVSGGRLPAAHLEALARVMDRASTLVRSVLAAPAGQERLLRMGSGHSVARFTRDLEVWVAALDPAGLDRSVDGQRRKRYLHLSESGDGMHLKGRLDRLAGEYLRRALDHVGGAPGEDRTPEQARADALEALAVAALSEPGHRATGASVRPHVSLVVREETFVAARAELARRRRNRDAADSPGAAMVAGNDVTLVPPATTEDGVALAAWQVARVLCDATVSRIVLDAASEPLDLGRTMRLYTGMQRRAVIQRDQVCAFGDCGRVPRWCEVHHMDWWDRDDGATDVNRGVLLCVYHHHLVHQLDLTIRRLPADPDPPPGSLPRPRYQFTDPYGRTPPGSRARGDTGADPGRSRA